MSQASEEGSPTSSRFFWWLAAILTVEALALAILFAPNERFTRFAYNDSGADLVIPTLLARGLRPGLDFGYIYGLLPLAITRVAQTTLGATPDTCRLLALACVLATAWGMARFASALRVGPVGVALIILSLPDLFQATTIVLVHALEPALLVNALAFQARGRRAEALAFVTIALFVKPSMPYLFGLILVVTIVTSDRRQAWRTWLPAAMIGLAVAMTMAVLFGIGPLVHTLLPGAGLEVYKASGYGFFRGAGRAFWLIPGGGVRDYLRYEVGAWLAGTALLVIGGLAAGVRLARRRASVNDEMVLTCALLHFGFVSLFYGNRSSWVYYYPILILGLAAIAARGRLHSALVAVVVLLIVLNSKAKLDLPARLWKTDGRSEITLGLWASPSERAEFAHVRELIRTHGRAALLARVDGLCVLMPDEFAQAEVSYLVPGHVVPSELQRKSLQVANSPLIVRVRPRNDPTRGGYESWPELARALDGCETIFSGELFEVERRTRAPWE